MPVHTRNSSWLCPWRQMNRRRKRRKERTGFSWVIGVDGCWSLLGGNAWDRRAEGRTGAAAHDGHELTMGVWVGGRALALQERVGKRLCRSQTAVRVARPITVRRSRFGVDNVRVWGPCSECINMRS